MSRMKQLFVVYSRDETCSMMAAPVDIPSRDTSILSQSPVVSYGTLSNFKTQDSEGVPLQSPWTLWLDKATQGCSASEYKSNLKKIYTFNTIQGFWAVFNNIPTVDEIQVRYSYHLMRYDRLPIWEEPYNQKGGTWRFRCSKPDTSRVWKELLLAAIGEQFSDSLDPNDEICGLTVAIRDRIDLIQVWNVSANYAKHASIIPKVKSLLPDIDFHDPFYKAHETHFAYEGHGSR